MGLVAGAATATAAFAGQGPLAVTYEALRTAAPDGRQSRVEGLAIERGAFRLELNGTVHHLAPVDGVVPGAVFIGNGKLTVTPATPSERRHLAQRTGRPDGLTDNFRQALLLFSDRTADQVLAAAPAVEATPDAAAVAGAGSLLEHARSNGMDLALELLRSRANETGRGQGVFYAVIEGETLRRAVVGLDPAGVLDGEEACLRVTEGPDPGYWFSEGSAAALPLVDAHHYAIDSSITGGTELAATSEVRLEVTAPRVQVVPFDLLPTLRIGGAQLVGESAGASAVEVVHGEGGAAILLPRPYAAGETMTLRLEYSGSGVLEDDGVDTYRVEARTNWYPNFGGLKDRATFDLTFRVPKDLTVVGVGREVSSRIDKGTLVSQWKAEAPIAVAGFNYGDFKKTERREENTGTLVEVYASKGTPDAITELNQYLASVSGATDPRQLAAMAGDDSTYLDTYSGPSSVGVSTGAVAEVALADAINSVQVFTNLFGPLEQNRLAMTQQSQWSFGQAWPGLVYLPYLTGLSKMLQMELGLDGYAGFYDEVGIHEIAHQWWGHAIGWQSYRDQWLSEGFAEFSTALVVELTKGGLAHREFWNRRRGAVLGRPAGGGNPAYLAGPLTLGFRASTAANPHGYSALVYSKGAYVLHMLRMLMRDRTSAHPDERFFAMMKDFATSQRGRQASTADFQRVVERHIVPELDATRDGKVDWFFDQWVYGTEVPIFSADVKIEKVAKDKYRLTGTVGQSNVPGDFLTLVGLYVDLGKGKMAQIGRMPFRGSMSHQLDVTVDLPHKPKAVLINAEREVLAFDE